jgi:PhoH-like ATPase
MEKKKSFVLDTNVPLHDYSCMDHFEEHDIYIPIVVLEEIDSFKKGNEQINFNAREFSRRMDEWLGSGIVSQTGVSLGEGKGNIFLIKGVLYPQTMKDELFVPSPDNKIIATALHLKNEGKNVVLVTKDIILRAKAISFGIDAEDYKNDQVKDLSVITHSVSHLILSEERVKILRKSKKEYLQEPEETKEIGLNHFIVLNDYQYLRKTDNGLKVINNVKGIQGIDGLDREQDCCFDALLDPKITLVAITGKAGTGKTLLSIAAALYQKDDYPNILAARPMVQLQNKDMGFLPGDVKEKIRPYMQPLYDNLEIIRTAITDKYKSTPAALVHKHNSNRGSNKGTSSNQAVEVAGAGPLDKKEPIESWAIAKGVNIEAFNFIRGRSIRDTFFIIDEAQNITPAEAKTIISRAGDGTKIILCGDIDQVDSPYQDARSNGLSYVIDRLVGEKIFCHIHLTKGYRSELATLAADKL